MSHHPNNYLYLIDMKAITEIKSCSSEKEGVLAQFWFKLHKCCVNLTLFSYGV